MPTKRSRRLVSTIATGSLAAFLLGASSALTALCGPFVDVASDGFCPLVLEIFYLGITTGTTPTTYDPAANVSRLQMAAFLSRTVDGVLRRGGRRAPLNQYWTTTAQSNLNLTTVGSNPVLAASDGADIWVANSVSGTVSRVRGSDGRLLETWTGATSASGVLAVTGRILVTGLFIPGALYLIDPRQPAGVVSTVATVANPTGLAFDGSRVWAVSFSSGISIVTPGAIPWAVTTVTAGFVQPAGILYDGAHIWATDQTAGTLLKLDAGGGILQTVTVGALPQVPIFDGTNIWVPNRTAQSLSVVRASTGAVLATLTGNGLNGPFATAFDGQRVLVTNFAGNSVSLWRAADLSSIGSLSTGAATAPAGACSDGIDFWVALFGSGKLARF